MNASLQRLVSLFFATIVFGMLATMVAPALAGSMAHAQSTAAPMNVASASSVVAMRETTAVVARGTARITVARATRALLRGDTLVASDFAFADTTIVWHWNTVSPSVTRPEVGWMIRRAIAAGEVLRSPAVVPAPIVTLGTKVKVLWQDGPVRLVLSGVATNSAALGAAVTVRVDRNRRLDGVAVAPNTVRLR